jgi:hypothetical protein
MSPPPAARLAAAAGGAVYSVASAASQPSGRDGAFASTTAGAWMSPASVALLRRQDPTVLASRLQARTAGPTRIPPATRSVATATPMVNDSDAAVRDMGTLVLPRRNTVIRLGINGNSGVLRAEEA